MIFNDKRSVINFIILLIFSTVTALFLTNKANEAVAEIKKIEEMPIFLGKKNIEGQL